MTLWIVRDTGEDGELLPYVTVWTSRPKRWRIGETHGWFSPEFGLEGWVASLWLREAERRFGVVPDDDRQVICAVRNSDERRAHLHAVMASMPEAA